MEGCQCPGGTRSSPLPLTYRQRTLWFGFLTSTQELPLLDLPAPLHTRSSHPQPPERVLLTLVTSVLSIYIMMSMFVFRAEPCGQL